MVRRGSLPVLKGMPMHAASPLQIREATASDAETVTGFVVAMALDSEGIELAPAAVRTAVVTALDDPARARYWLAMQGERAVGQLMITTEWSDWNNAWYWWIQSVYVVPDCRRRGVFRETYRHVATVARERGDVCAIRLYVEHENASARRAYEQIGMAEAPYAVYEERLDEEQV